MPVHQLLFFRPRQYVTAVHVVDTMLPSDDRPIAAETVAQRADILLSRINAPAGPDIRRALDLLEFVLPLLILRFRRFSRLSPQSRRKLLERIIASHGLLRDLVRTLKLITTFCYYSDEKVRRSIGYVNFEERPRYSGLNTLPYTYSPPEAGLDESV
jgi:hypothetical protein